jgi:hypothetical protein
MGDANRKASTIIDCPWKLVILERLFVAINFESGMLVGFGVGSVRMLAKSIRPEAFWSTVTPSAGDVVSE